MNDASKEKWYEASKRSRISLGDGSAQCPCGEKQGLSNFYASFGDHNWYCSPCIGRMRKILSELTDYELATPLELKIRTMEEIYGEPGQFWKKMNDGKKRMQRDEQYESEISDLLKVIRDERNNLGSV